MSDTGGKINAFIYHLCKNKMAQPFTRLVTSSLDRKGFRSNRFNSRSSGKVSAQITGSPKKTIGGFKESSRDKRTESFRIKEGPLG